MIMLFYAFLIMMTVLAAVGVLWPLFRKNMTDAVSETQDVQVYKDQLAVVERDLAYGVLTGEQAADIRLEIQRRLLAVTENKTGRPGTLGRRPLVLFVVLMLSVGGFGLYVLLGSPGYPDLPYLERMADRAGISPAESERLYSDLDALNRALRDTPGDAALWRGVGDLNRRLTRFDMAASAYRNALRHGDRQVDTLVSMGEMLVWSDPGGMVRPEAGEVFSLALKRAPGDPRARYYLGLMAAQGDDVPRALSIWQELDVDLADDSPLRAMVREDITRARAVLERAAGEGKTDRETAEKMIAALAEQLEKNPERRDGWVILGRAHAAMGRPAEAKEAFLRALALYPGDSDERRQVEEMLKAVEKP